MQIEQIYVACCKPEMRILRACIASIRYWYPDVSISLVKDKYRGPFDTRDIERHWNVSVYPSGVPYGSPLAKLQPMLRTERETYLLLDADICFVGPVLDAFEACNAEFVVDPQFRDLDAEFAELFFDEQKLKIFDSEYKYPGFAFNTGQIVQTSGLVAREDFEGLLEWTGDKPTVIREDIFKLSDQGLLNYVLVKKRDRGELRLETAPKFMMWGGLPEVDAIQIADRNDPNVRPLLVHWGGGRVTRSLFRKMYGSEILGFYEKLFYSRIPFGMLKRGLCYAGIGASALGRRITRFGSLFSKRTKTHQPIQAQGSST